jgi:hypothetical protein
VADLEQGFDDAPVGDVPAFVVGVHDVDLEDDVDDTVGSGPGSAEDGAQSSLLHGATHHGPDVARIVQGRVGSDGSRQRDVIGADN